MSPLFPLHPLAEEREWVGGRYKYPIEIREAGKIIRPDVIFWMELPGGMLLATTLLDPRQPVSFAETLEQAMEIPAVGLPRRPTRIRVPDDRSAKELRRAAGGIPIVVAPVPELDAAFAELTAMAEADAQPSYLGDGDIAPAVVAEFFAAAHSLFRAAPWRVVTEQQVIRVDMPDLKVKGACLSVIGGENESLGLLLFRTIEDFLSFGTRPAKGRRAKDPIAMRSMSFGRKKELPPSLIREIEQHRWPVAGARAYPTLFCVDRELNPVPAVARDFRIMTTCAHAFLTFFDGHRDLFEADHPETIRETITDDDDVAVTLTAPY